MQEKLENISFQNSCKISPGGRRKEDWRGEKKFWVKSHKLHKVIHPKYYKNSIESDTFLILADWAIKIG